ncbi:MAG TPA: TatD family hydrolase, partial [Mucilaginibacter sp.]|nr:TatD family hydrolase [Mucilaginibacter sp.]
MVLTDTHTHQYYEADPVKRRELMQRCLDNGISRLFLPNVDSASIELVFSQVEAFPQYCFPMLGLHPCDVKANWKDELNTIEDAIAKDKIYAIGEIGIDLYWDKTTLPEQIEAFKIQIGWAKKLKLPIVIHCRNSFDEIFDVLRSEYDENLRGILHCFTGTLEQAHQLTDMGFY